jgi:hypothetical protein
MGSAISSSTNSEYHLAAPMHAHAASEPAQRGAKPASHDNEYNSLDFGGTKDNMKTKVATSDGDSCGLYSHLNEGDEDSYNLVERGRKSEYIDGEYSHIQQN